MILVTGAAGFIGMNLCNHLMENLVDTVGFDALKIESCPLWTTDLKVPLFQGDLCNISAVQQVFRQFPITGVVHLAAESHVDRSISDSSPFWKTNVIGTHNLMSVAMAHEVPLFINQITDEVYGEKPTGEAYEGDKFAPTSPYPCSKMAQYWVGQSFKTTYGFPVISTFPVNNFGPYQNKEKLVPKFLVRLAAGLSVPLMASSHFERDWLAVEDMCSAFRILLEKGKPGDYNIGADNHHSNLAITEKMVKLVGASMDQVETIPDRKAHDCRYAVNSDKIKTLGWKPRYSFDDYLKKTAAWYQERS